MTPFGQRRNPRAWAKRNNRELVRDCEAFLLGRMAERLEERGAAVPSWAWLNLLAHGSQAELRQECENEVPSGLPRHRLWRQARAYLAVEVLAAAGQSGSLEIVQERVLRPLELELVGARAAALWQPSQWAARVNSVLGAFREEAIHMVGREWSMRGKA